MSDRIAWVIVVIAVIGVALSTASLVAHYRESPTEFCSIDETFNCDIVNRSIYSKFLGVPVAAIGVAGYTLVLLLALINRQKKWASALLVLGSFAGLGFALYLTYIEARILAVYCILCLGSLACILTISVLSVVRHVRTREFVF